jgi:hypothetical protein
MPFIAIVIGAIMIVAAFNNTQGQLATALETDIPGFFKWGVAIVAILGLGYIPGLTQISRWLLGLVVLVVVLTQYKNLIQGFQNFAQTGQQTATQSAQSEEQSAQAYAAQATQSEAAFNQLTSGGGNSAGNAQALAASVLSNPALDAAIIGA